MNSRTKNTLVGLLATLIWSSAVFAFHSISVGFGPFLGGAIEMSVSGLFLMLISARRGQFGEIFSHPKRAYILAGGGWILDLLFFAVAVGFSTSSELVVVGLINYLWPILTIICSILILKNKWTWKLPLAFLIAILGILLCKSSGFIGPNAVTPPLYSSNYVVMFIGSTFWALYSVFIKRDADPSKATPVPIFMLITSALFLALYAFIGKEVHPTIGDFVFIVGWSFISAIAYLSWDIGMRYGDMIAVSASAMLIPLFSTIITTLGTGQELSLTIVLAAILVVGGSYLARKSVQE